MSKRPLLFTSLIALSPGCSLIYADDSTGTVTNGDSSESGELNFTATSGSMSTGTSSHPFTATSEMPSTTTTNDTALTESAAMPSTSESTSSIGAPACPDGTIDDGEECDDGNEIDNDACSNNCSHNCQNGTVDIGEECDDGNQIDDDTCNNMCLSNCGNGTINTSEGCDDGNQIDDDTCNNMCLSNCGDNNLNTGEECDDGNNDDNDACNNQCLLNCGDGEIDPSEECDNGKPDGASPCTDCKKTGLYAFITSMPYSANLGGLDEADKLCTSLAFQFDHSPNRSYKAWLSQRDPFQIITEPKNSFNLNCGRPIFTTNNELVANNFAALLQNGPEAPIIYNEKMNSSSGSYAWTRTSGGGTMIESYDYQGIDVSDCGDWAFSFSLNKNSSNSGAIVGLATDSPPDQFDPKTNWTAYEGRICNVQDVHLYCFEQCP